MISKIKGKVNKQLIAQVAFITALVVIATPSIAYAAGNTYADNLSNWIMAGVKVIALAIVGAFAVKFLIKRQMIQFIGFLVLAGLILVITYDPMKLKSIGDYLWGVIFG